MIGISIFYLIFFVSLRVNHETGVTHWMCWNPIYNEWIRYLVHTNETAEISHLYNCFVCNFFTWISNASTWKYIIYSILFKAFICFWIYYNMFFWKLKKISKLKFWMFDEWVFFNSIYCKRKTIAMNKLILSKRNGINVSTNDLYST